MAESEDVKPGVAALLAEGESKDETTEKSPQDDTTSPPEAKPEDSKDGTPYSGKFKQFKTVEDLEQSFANSFTEAQRLNTKIQELETTKQGLEEEVPAADPKTTDEITQKVSVLEQKINAYELRQRSIDEREYNDWMADHPGLTDNQPLVKDLIDELELIGAKAVKKGEFVSMQEGLNRAWKRVAPSDMEEAELVGATKQAAKESAGTSAATGSSPRSDGPSTHTLTADEKRTAKQYGFTDEEYLEQKLKK